MTPQRRSAPSPGADGDATHGVRQRPGPGLTGPEPRRGRAVRSDDAEGRPCTAAPVGRRTWRRQDPRWGAATIGARIRAAARTIGRGRPGRRELAAWRARCPWPAALLAALLLSRLIFYVALALDDRLLPAGAPWSGAVEAPGPAWLGEHWRWDAIHYYTIAVGGYGASPAAVPKVSPTDHLPAFFPLLPLLIRATATVLGGLRPPAPVPLAVSGPAPLLAGLLVANVAILVAFRHLFALALLEGGDALLARRAVLYAAFAPFAFCYAVPYTEGLFLATSTGAFLAARRGQWLRAGLWAAAASATRSVGLLLLPALALMALLAWCRGAVRGAARWRAAAGLLLAPTGLLAFMLQLYRVDGDPLAWLHASQRFWHRDLVFPVVTL